MWRIKIQSRMKKLICKILGHKYHYNFNKCECKRCGVKWKSVKNPKYDGTNLMHEDIFMWEEILKE